VAIQTAVQVSDLHTLSTWGLLRPGFVTTDGNEIGINPFQEYLWAQMESCLAELDELLAGDKCALLLNGDLIDGNHHKSMEILHVDETEHARAAIWSVQPLLERASKVFVIEGTESHTGNFERYIAEKIKGQKNPDTGVPIFQYLDIDIHGCPCRFAHHMSATSRVYLEASQLSIHLGNEQLAAMRADETVPKLLGCGHRHRQGWYTDGKAGMVVSPAWQGLTRWARKAVPSGRTNPGFAFMDWRNKPKGSLPDVKLILRPPKQNTRVVI